MSARRRRCSSQSPDGARCEGTEGHAGQCGHGEDRWWRSDVEHAVEQLRQRVADGPLDRLLGTLITIELLTGKSATGVLTGFHVDESGAPLQLTLRRAPRLVGSEVMFVPYAAVALICPMEGRPTL